MKKIGLLILPLLLLISACETNEYVVPNRTVVVNIQPGEWRSVDGGINYTAPIDMPEIDDYFNERGGVLAYLSLGDRTYEALPQVYGGIAYNYITRPGQVVLELQSSDGQGRISPPANVITVKIVLIDSEY